MKIMITLTNESNVFEAVVNIGVPLSISKRFVEIILTKEQIDLISRARLSGSDLTYSISSIDLMT